MKIKFSNLEFNKLKEILFFLKSISKGETEQEKIADVVAEKIFRFFPNVSTAQTLQLSYLFENILEKAEKAEELFSILKISEIYKDLEIDLSGRSKIKNKKFWEIKLESLEQLFLIAQQNKEISINKQIINGKTLDCLKNIKRNDYDSLEKKFLSKNIISKKKFDEIKEKVKKIFSNIDFLEIIFFYCNSKENSEIEFFLSHLFTRIELLFQDKELENEVNKIFFETIQDLIKKNN